MVFVEDFIELVWQLLAVQIYGTPEHPSRPIWRNTLRTIAVVGPLISIGTMLNLWGGFSLPLGVHLIWMVCALFILPAEFFLGSKRIWGGIVVVLLTWGGIFYVVNYM